MMPGQISLAARRITVSFTVKVEGLKELEKALLELSTATAKNVGRRTLRKAGQPVADKMNALAPEGGTSEDGPLNESYSVSTRLNRTQARAERKAGKDDVFMYIGTNDVAGIQQEFGNERHQAQPHARPAWESEKFETLDRIRDNLTVEVRKAAERAARKALKSK